jgi:four helix bundle protein
MPTARQDLIERALQFACSVSELRRRVPPTDTDLSHLTHQLFKAASAIGANLEEGQVAFSRRDMAVKYAIALRESREAHYWLRLWATRSEWTAEVQPLVREANEFVAMLTVSVRRLREP